MTIKIEANNLNLQFGKNKALDNLNFKLEGPKIYGLLGRNGAGKTSLLSILASFRQPTSGKLLINGEEPFENAKLMQQIHFVYNKDYKEETENLKSYLEDAKRYRPNFNQEYARYLVEKFNLPLKKPLKELSQGMQSAVNVTIGLASRSPITIFDESYNGMDAPTREIFYKEVLEEQSNHPRVMVLSTHLVSEMDYLFDEVVIIKNGRLILQDDYESIVSKGATIIGHSEKVDQFVASMKQLNTQKLGSTKSVTILGDLSDAQRKDARNQGLEVGPVSLQDLFIYLTEGEDE